MIASGLHLVTLDALPMLGLGETPVRIGILDLLRMIEGHGAEPAPGTPLLVQGLDDLVDAAEVPALVLATMRETLVAARGYFAWKAIPLVVVLRGPVDEPPGDRGLQLRSGESVVPLAPLFGTRLTRARPSLPGWWHSPQVG